MRLWQATIAYSGDALHTPLITSGQAPSRRCGAAGLRAVCGAPMRAAVKVDPDWDEAA